MDTLKKNEPVTTSRLGRYEMVMKIDGIRTLIDNLATKSNTPQKKRMEMKLQILNNFVANELNHKDQYEHIFKTENGSIYFTLKNGEAFRIKMGAQKESDLLQQPTEKLFFVDDKQLFDFLTIRADEKIFDKKIIGYSFKTKPLKIGTTPFEFGLIGDSSIIYKEEEGKLTILFDLNGSFAKQSHFGHHVSEIIK